MKSGTEYLDQITDVKCPYCGGMLLATRADDGEVRIVYHQGSHLIFNDLLLDKLRGWEVGLDVDSWLTWLHSDPVMRQLKRARVRYGVVTSRHRDASLR